MSTPENIPLYTDYPHYMANNSSYFKSALFYDPSGTDHFPTTICPAARALSSIPGAIMLPLPSMFNLIAASQIKISVASGYGQFFVNTSSARHERQKLTIQQGISYIEYLRAEEFKLFRDWHSYPFANWR